MTHRRGSALAIGLVEPGVEEESAELKQAVEREPPGVYLCLVDVSLEHWTVDAPRNNGERSRRKRYDYQSLHR